MAGINLGSKPAAEESEKVKAETTPVVEEASGNVGLYSSGGIAKFRLGRFQFEKGVLRLEGKDVAEFEKVLDQLPLVERNRITKLDVASAERIARAHLAKQGGTTQQTDSSTGERGRTADVGTEDLGHASLSQQDANAVVDVNTGKPADAAATVGQKPLHEA